jgi:2'-5' RNA ligase
MGLFLGVPVPTNLIPARRVQLDPLGLHITLSHFGQADANDLIDKLPAIVHPVDCFQASVKGVSYLGRCTVQLAFPVQRFQSITEGVKRNLPPDIKVSGGEIPHVTIAKRRVPLGNYSPEEINTSLEFPVTELCLYSSKQGKVSVVRRYKLTTQRLLFNE